MDALNTHTLCHFATVEEAIREAAEATRDTKSVAAVVRSIHGRYGWTFSVIPWWAAVVTHVRNGEEQDWPKMTKRQAEAWDEGYNDWRRGRDGTPWTHWYLEGLDAFYRQGYEQAKADHTEIGVDGAPARRQAARPSEIAP